MPTAKGLEVYDIVRRMRIADVEMTGMWELALGKIASGEIRPVTFTSSIDIYTRQIVSELLAVQITRPEYVSCPCPKCHEGQVRLYPKAAKCSDPDCALLLFRNINGRTLTDEELLTILGGGKTPYLKFISRRSGKPYLAALSLDEEYALALEFKEKTGQ